MAIADNSYSSLVSVASRTPRWANVSGTFDGTTNPTKTQVELFINEVSALLNVAMSESGFTIPIDQEDAKLLMDMFVAEEVASMVLGLHGSGRFADRGRKSDKSNRFTMIQNDVERFIRRNEYGFRKLGVAGESICSGNC